MEAYELFHSCRVGDIDAVRNLVEDEDVNLNVRDCWDSTPLYYACLCGHSSLVDFLLSNGAKCEPNTFDGERCLYAALTDRIRKILRDYKAITSDCMRRDSYREFLRRCLERPDFADVCFMVHGEKFLAHRVVLAARSSYFANMLETKWKDKDVVHLNHPLVKPWAFQSVLQFLYTDRLDIDVSKATDCVLLARQCQLVTMKESLETRIQDIEMMELSKPGTRKIKVISIEPDASSTHLADEYSKIVELAIPSPYKQQQFPIQFEEFFRPFTMSLPNDDSAEDFDRPPYVDICINVEEYRFYCHKVFLCGRSDYFKALLADHFSEAFIPEADAIPEVTLHDVSAEIFAAVLSFVYRDTAELTVENLYNVLCAADIYLLNGLKRVCSNMISGQLDVDNALTILRTARLFSLEKLEQLCCDFIAAYFDKFYDDPEFHNLILEDAASIKDREETDSIPIVDDIRFHLYKTALPNGSDSFSLTLSNTSEDFFFMLNNLLLRLGLDC